MKSLNLAFRFALEMLALLALFLFGLSLSDDLIMQLIVALGLPALSVGVWGTYVAPKASRRLPDPARLGVELVIFFAGVLAFGFAVSWILAILFGLAVLVSVALMFLFGQRGR